MHQLKNNRTGELGIPKTEVECFYNDDILVFNFVAHDSSLISFSDKDNDELWRGNVVEIFLDVGEKDYYYQRSLSQLCRHAGKDLYKKAYQ